MPRGAMGYTDSLVHGRTLGCTEQLWGAGTPQNTEQPRGARSLPVHRQTQGCVRQLQVQGQAVGGRDSPVHGMAMGCMELPGHEWASGGADSAVHRAAPRFMVAVGDTENTPPTRSTDSPGCKEGPWVHRWVLLSLFLFQFGLHSFSWGEGRKLLFLPQCVPPWQQLHASSSSALCMPNLG